MNAQEMGLKLATERQATKAWYDGFKTADGAVDMTAEQVGEFNKRNEALGEMAKQYEAILVAERGIAENEAKLGPQGRMIKAEGPAEYKAGAPIETKAQLDVAMKSGLTKAADDFKRQGKGSFDLDISLKTLITTADHAPQADRQGTYGSALYYGNVEDLFMSGNTDSKSIDYYVQTTDTDNAAAVAQGSAATDSAFSWTLSTDPVETLQTWIPLTREALEDNAGMQSIVEGLLADRLQKLSNSQFLAGNGTTPNISGITDRAGLQTQAKGADPSFDAIHKAVTKVEVTGDAIVDALLIHPTDWQNIRLTRTVDGIYILGNPADTASLNLFGLPVRKTTGIAAAGTALVGAFGSYAQVFNRKGLTVEISTEHSTYFTERKVAIALHRRAALAVYRDSAFCTVTGL